MEGINKHLKHILLAGWLGVLLFFLAGIPENSYQILDVKISISIANYLKASPTISSFLYQFNSIDHIFINLPIIIGIILLAITQLKSNRRQALLSVILALFWVELWIFALINPIFSKITIMDFNIVPEVESWLSETNNGISSSNSIVSHHVFAMFFYASYCYRKDFSTIAKISIWLCALTFAIPPILNAKHWLSDWLFSAWFTYSSIHLSKFIDIESRILRFFKQE